MATERIRQRIERLLDQIEEFADQEDWDSVSRISSQVLDLDESNEDAITFLRMAERRLGTPDGSVVTVPSETPISSTEPSLPTPKKDPDTFGDGRYEVKRFLGEGGKKMVYLAHDDTLDRDVAFALIKTEGLDSIGLTRISREAQAMGRLGSHPHIVTVFDLGQHDGQPYMVTELMGGGDVEGVIEDAPDNRIPLDQCVNIAIETCRGLEFAHSKGIVHRDLKPGNVWLTADGIAKIGDFGLAVASDRSRLTQEGMMVGTVSYMPPEQAMGGDVTQRADLYSLGAMMYEMVTGRPPFLGDDSIAIIGQHINTPPVAPTWHNAGCPKPLEALILRLLAKNPDERPESASDVLIVMEGLELPGSGEQPSSTVISSSAEGEANVLDGVASGIFVGRQREMGDLKAALEDVLSGRGKMVTLVGEPGIGKTRTSQELATYAGLRGAKVLWGRCYEEQGVPPYWPWVQAIRTYVRDEEPQKLSTEMGAGAADISEVVPDVRTQLPGLPQSPQLEPEQARFRLFDAITAFLHSASQSRPLVVVLDDLHWADKPSLLLLQFIAREIGNSRLMIVGTYRDMELSRQHPLSESLGELTRERAFQRVLLRGLSQEDVARFVEVAAGVDPDQGLVNAVYTQTEGNPLFVTEVVRLLVQEGQLNQASNLNTTGRQTDSWAVRIPEGVREVIGRRLNKLTERCNETLTVASIVGREFEFDQLKTLVDNLSDDMLLDVLEEALAARVIEEMPDSIGRYQFTHALLQETLMDELSLTRRVRLHARIAESLEALYGDQDKQHATELVFHFEQAQAMLGTEKLIKYSVIAGKAALNTFAFEEGRSHFERARECLTSDSDLLVRAEILYGYGRARSATQEGDFQICWELMEESFYTFMELGHIKEAISVAENLNPDIVRLSKGTDTLLLEALRHTEGESTERARILSFLAISQAAQGQMEEASVTLNEALNNASECGEQGIQAVVMSQQAGLAVQRFDFDYAEAKALQAYELATQLKDGASIAATLISLSALYKATCNLEGLERVVKIEENLANSGMRFQRNSALSLSRAWSHWFNGNPSGVAEVYVMLRESNMGYAQTPEGVYLLEIGDESAGRRQLDNVVNYANSEENPILAHFIQGLAWSSILLGTNEYADHARLMLDSVRGDESIQSSVDVLVGKAFIAVCTGDIEFGEEVFLELSAIPNMVLGLQVTSRAKGILAKMLGENELARQYLKEAIDFCESRGMKPELAWAYSDMSELVAEIDDNRATSQQLVDKALAIANDIGMKPLTNRILGRRDILKA